MRLARVALLALVVFLLCFGMLSNPPGPLLEGLERLTLQHRFRLRGELPPSPRLVLIGFDYSTAERYGLLATDHHLPYAIALKRLFAAGCSAVGLDVLLEPDPKGEGPLLQAMQAGPVVLVCEHSDMLSPPKLPGASEELVLEKGADVPRVSGLTWPQADLAKAAYAVATADTSCSDRRFAHSVPLAQVTRRGTVVPHFALALYYAANRLPLETHFFRTYARLADKRKVPLGFHAALEANYLGPAAYLPEVDFDDVMKGTFDPALVRGKVCIIGATDSRLGDLIFNPFSGVFSGPAFNATLLDNLFEDRTPRTFHKGLQLAAALALSILLVLAFGLFEGIFIPFLLTAVLLTLGVVASDGLFLWCNTLVPVSVLAVYAGLLTTTLTVERLFELGLERRKLEHALALYAGAPQAALDTLETSEPSGERRVITALICDLRHFTQSTSNLAPEEVVHFLNGYFEQVSELVQRHFGTVDKFMGDGFLALFNAPLLDSEHRRHALQCALALLELVPRLQREWEKTPLERLDMAIGLDTGESVVGQVGSHTRQQYTAIGRPVNLAAHLQEYCRKEGARLLVSGRVIEGLESELKLRRVESPEISEELEAPCYEVLGFLPSTPASNLKLEGESDGES